MQLFPPSLLSERRSRFPPNLSSSPSPPDVMVPSLQAKVQNPLRGQLKLFESVLGKIEISLCGNLVGLSGKQSVGILLPLRLLVRPPVVPLAFFTIIIAELPRISGDKLLKSTLSPLPYMGSADVANAIRLCIGMLNELCVKLLRKIALPPLHLCASLGKATANLLSLW